MKRLPYHDSTRDASGSTWRGANNQETADARRLGYYEKSLVLQSALEEYRRLRDAGETVEPEQFSSRFSNYQKSVRRLIDVDSAMEDLQALKDPWPQVGGEFLGFDLLGELGSGAIARVFLASERELGGRIVAIKVSLEATTEAATLGRLQHPNIVEVYSVKQDPQSGMSAVCMPYRGGATLTDLLDETMRQGHHPARGTVVLDVARRMTNLELLGEDQSTPRSPEAKLTNGTFTDAIVHLGLRLASALQYAHDNGVLHRDLKPSNVLITPHGQPMLLDFNLSFDAAINVLPRGGTLPYMAPEQIKEGIQTEPIRESSVGPRADVFSLGVILYELLTGNLPYRGPPNHLGPLSASMWQLDAQRAGFKAVSEFNSQVAPSVVASIHRCLQLDPRDRFASMVELANTLQQHFRWHRRAVRWTRRHALSVGTTAAIGIVATVASGAYYASLAPYPDRQFAQGKAAFLRDDFEAALPPLGRAIDAEPRNSKALLLRVVCFQKLGRHNDAFLDLARINTFAPSAEAYELEGYSEFRMGNRGEAENKYLKAARFNPNDARMLLKHAYLGISATSETGEFLISADRAIELDGSRYEAYLVRAKLTMKSPDRTATGLDSIANDAETVARLARPNSPDAALEVAELWSFIAGHDARFLDGAKVRLNRAVDIGVTQRWLLDSFSRFHEFSDESWFKELVDRADRHDRRRTRLLRDVIIIPDIHLGDSVKRVLDDI